MGEGEGRGDSERESPTRRRLIELGVLGALRSSPRERGVTSDDGCFAAGLDFLGVWLDTGEATLLWSGERAEGILMGWRDLAKRWKLGELVGDSGTAREESRATLLRRGPAGLRTDD